jgi:hypothetical protein
MAILVFAQLFGGSLFISLSEVLFTNGLRSGLDQYAPGVNSTAVIEAGAAAFREVVTADQLPGVLKAYSTGVDHSLYLATGSVAVALVFCWGMGWQKIKKASIPGASK